MAESTDEDTMKHFWDRILKTFPCIEEDHLRGKSSIIEKSGATCENNLNTQRCCWHCDQFETCLPKWENFIFGKGGDEDITCPITGIRRWCSACRDKRRKRNVFR